MIIRVTERRLQVRSTILHEILESGLLSSGQAAGIWRKVQCASSMLWSKYGAGNLRALIRRQREQTTTLFVKFFIEM